MTTKSAKNLVGGGDCGEVRRRLTAWRAQRSPGERIPEELWEAAARVAGDEGVAAISRALGLSDYDLRRRVERQSAGAKRSSAGPVFVELARGPQTSEAAAATIEVVRSDGTRVMVRLGALVESMMRAGR